MCCIRIYKASIYLYISKFERIGPKEPIEQTEQV